MRKSSDGTDYVINYSFVKVNAFPTCEYGVVLYTFSLFYIWG